MLDCQTGPAAIVPPAIANCDLTPVYWCTRVRETLIKKSLPIEE